MPVADTAHAPTVPTALTAAPKRVAFATKRPKDVPKLFCRTDIIKPNGAEIIIHPDTAVVAVYRTIGHAAMNRVTKACEKAGVPYVQAGTGVFRTLDDIKTRSGIDLHPWRKRGFWKDVVGRFLVEHCLPGKTWGERAEIVNVYFKGLKYKQRFTKRAIEQAFRNSHPDLPLCDGVTLPRTKGDRDTRPGRVKACAHPDASDVPDTRCPDCGMVRGRDAPPQPEARVSTPIAITDGAYPDPAARDDFRAVAENLAALMQAAGVTEVTFITDDTGKVLWSGKEKVVRVVEQGFSNEAG